jgi:hypothetical protein
METMLNKPHLADNCRREVICQNFAKKFGDQERPQPLFRRKKFQGVVNTVII